MDKERPATRSIENSSQQTRQTNARSDAHWAFDQV